MRNVVLIAVFFISVFSLDAQKSEWCLSTIQNHESRLNSDPDYKLHIKEWIRKTAPLIKERRENKNPNCTSGPIIVPVAIHFDSGIVPASQEACAITIAQDQIAELNNEIAGLDVDAPLINQFASCFGPNILGDACIEFCIADQNHPAGSGLVDGDLAITFGQLNFNVPSGNFTPVNSAWAGYVNIYVDNLAGGLLGVSNGIPGSFNGDGVLVDNCVFGTGAINCPGVQSSGSSGCFGLFADGETLAHEIGHYFGLFHIWGDNSGCNGSQDNIPDTPNMTSNYSSYNSCSNHTSCNNLPQTCGSEDMYMNFMSYASNNCMYMFTSDQSDVMNATAVAKGYTTSSPKCSSNPSSGPVADFSPIGNLSTCGLECITYNDLSTGTPTSWTWAFTVTSGDITLDIATSTLANPVVCLTAGTGGNIQTTLTVSNSSGSDMITQNLTVNVAPPLNLYADTDNDEFGDINDQISSCTQVQGYVMDNTDCDDTDPLINPDATEICDGEDNNCDGNTDEGVTTTYYADSDMDGFGDPNNSTQACSAPANFVSDNTDCDDTDSSVNPSASEACDGADNNCDGNIDEGVTTTYYADSDMDGFGDAANSVQACMAPLNFVTDNTDCDDSNSNNFPGNTESCDGQDNNCDTIVDEGCSNLPPCDDDYLIINNITQSVYRAEINIISDAIVVSNVLFTAGTDIDLIAPFEVTIGNDFEARIEPCDNTLVNREGTVSKFINDQFDLKAELARTFSENEKDLQLTIKKDTQTINFETQVSIDTYNEVLNKVVADLENGAYHLEIKKGEKSVKQDLFIIN